MEFLLVHFSEKRSVLIDGYDTGNVGETIPVGEGTHTIRLGGSANYHPASFKIKIAATTAIKPMEVKFEKAH